MEVTERRRKQEFAEEMRRIAEEDYPKAEKIRVVLDNLPTHTAAAFYEGSRYHFGNFVLGRNG